MVRLISIGTLVIFIVLGSIVAGVAESKSEEELSTLEGVLKVHPKFLYKYYIVAYGGQTCALYGHDHMSEYVKLKDIEPGTRIRVRGRLGTFLHDGGTEDNPSPFVQTWVIYMEVEEVTKLGETGNNKEAIELRQQQIVLNKPNDVALVAKEISFEDYTKMKAEYARKHENYKPGYAITYRQKEGDDWRGYWLALESFDDSSVWIAELTQYQSKHKNSKNRV